MPQTSNSDQFWKVYTTHFGSASQADFISTTGATTVAVLPWNTDWRSKFVEATVGKILRSVALARLEIDLRGWHSWDLEVLLCIFVEPIGNARPFLWPIPMPAKTFLSAHWSLKCAICPWGIVQTPDLQTAWRKNDSESLDLFGTVTNEKQ